MKDETRFKGYNVVDLFGGKGMNENVRKQKKERKQKKHRKRTETKQCEEEEKTNSLHSLRRAIIKKNDYSVVQITFIV